MGFVEECVKYACPQGRARRAAPFRKERSSTKIRHHIQPSGEPTPPPPPLKGEAQVSMEEGGEGRAPILIPLLVRVAHLAKE